MSLQDTATATSETELTIEPRLLIDGRLVTTEQTFPSYNPANGDLVGHAPDATVVEARAAIDAARRAFDTTDWSTNVELRIRCLDQLHRALVEHRDELADLTIAVFGATRCPVVWKGAPDTPLVTLALGELIANHTDIPAGVVNVLSSSDPEVGAVLTTSPDVDVVTFTGSTATGRRIMAAASDTLKRVFLELGGKSAAIVLDDADFSAAALFAAFSMATHAGQGCALTSRLVVPQKHPDEIVNLIAQNFSLVRHGDPADEKTYMGPLISERQRDKVDGMVQRAVEAGG